MERIGVTTESSSVHVPCAQAEGALITTDIRVIDNAAIGAFIEATGDDNPVHLHDHAARAHGFPSRVAHGKLVQSIGIDLIRRAEAVRGFSPVLIEDSWRSRAPVFPNDTVFVCYSRKVKRGITYLSAEIFVNHVGDKTLVATGTITARVKPIGH